MFIQNPLLNCAFKVFISLNVVFVVLGLHVFGVYGDDHTIATSVCLGWLQREHTPPLFLATVTAGSHVMKYVVLSPTWM